MLGLQQRAEQRAGPVEQDLRQQQVGQPGGQFRTGLLRVAHVQPHQSRGGQQREQGARQQHHPGGGEQLLDVGPAPVLVALLRPHEHRDDHAGEHAADEQLEDAGRERVGHCERVVDHAEADRVGQHQLPAEACDAADQRRHRHRAAGLEQGLLALLLLLGRLGFRVLGFGVLGRPAAVWFAHCGDHLGVLFGAHVARGASECRDRLGQFVGVAGDAVPLRERGSGQRTGHLRNRLGRVSFLLTGTPPLVAEGSGAVLSVHQLIPSLGVRTRACTTRPC